MCPVKLKKISTSQRCKGNDGFTFGVVNVFPRVKDTNYYILRVIFQKRLCLKFGILIHQYHWIQQTDIDYSIELPYRCQE